MMITFADLRRIFAYYLLSACIGMALVIITITAWTYPYPSLTFVAACCAAFWLMTNVSRVFVQGATAAVGVLLYMTKKPEPRRRRHVRSARPQRVESERRVP